MLALHGFSAAELDHFRWWSHCCLLILGSAIKRKNSTPTKRNTPALPIKPMCPAAIVYFQCGICSRQPQQKQDWSQMQRNGKSAMLAAANRKETAESCRMMNCLSRDTNRNEAEQWQNGNCTNCFKADTVVAPSQAHDAV